MKSALKIISILKLPWRQRRTLCLKIFLMHMGTIQPSFILSTKSLQLAYFLTPQLSTNSLIFSMLVQIHKNQKLIENFLVGHGQKWAWLIWSQDSNIVCISRVK